MLILQRHIEESIIIRVPGTEQAITVMVAAISGGKNGGDPVVKLGFSAPQGVLILRSELDSMDGASPA